MGVKNKKILITAGPTWVPIDSVRVISNIATGETGILLAEELLKSGAKVTLALGATEGCCIDKKIKLIRFKFFGELKNIIIRELRAKKYDAVIHSAAVSDYKPAQTYKQKVKSGKKVWRITLVPTEKIIDLIKRIAGSSIVVGFKFEPHASGSVTIKRARQLLHRFNLDMVVANSINEAGYRAHILSRKNIFGPVFNKKDLSEKLAELLRQVLCSDQPKIGL